MTIRIQIARLPHGEGLPLPSYATPGAAGMDVVAAEDLDLAPGQGNPAGDGDITAQYQRQQGESFRPVPEPIGGPARLATGGLRHVSTSRASARARA